MDLRGTLDLTARSIGALASIGSDRVEQGLGLALPRTPEELCEPDVLNRLLQQHAAEGWPPLPSVSKARLPGVDFESSNCRNFLVEVDFDAEASGDGSEVPRSLYAKLPCDDLATRVFANTMGFWSLECHFCERIAHRIPIRVPRTYAVAERGARFVLLLENLHELPGAQLFINRDMAAGTTLERARMCLSMFAELHAAFWGTSPAERDALLPTHWNTYCSPSRRAMTLALNQAAIEPAHRAAPELVTREIADLCQLACQKWDRLIEAFFDGPLTLVHGDSHLGNCFEYATADGPRMGMIDFQGVHWGLGVRDVQYFLINSLDSELLAAHEDELLQHYLSELRTRGITLDLERAKAQYRALSFQTLMVGIVPLGMGALTEREHTLTRVLERGTAAARRLGLKDWIQRL